MFRPAYRPESIEVFSQLDEATLYDLIRRLEDVDADAVDSTSKDEMVFWYLDFTVSLQIAALTGLDVTRYRDGLRVEKAQKKLRQERSDRFYVMEGASRQYHYPTFVNIQVRQNGNGLM